MEKFIPREKLSKRAQNALNAKKRRTWGAISPETRKPNNPKAYDENKTRGGRYGAPGLMLFRVPAQLLRRRCESSV
jgi:hypothetical protein